MRREFLARDENGSAMSVRGSEGFIRPLIHNHFRDNGGQNTLLPTVSLRFASQTPQPEGVMVDRVGIEPTT